MGEIDVSQREHHPAGNCRPGRCFPCHGEGVKLNLLQTREERISSTLTQLDELDRSIASKEEGKRFPSAAEADIRRKLTADLEALEQDASIRDIYNVSRGLLDWLRQQDLERAKELSDYFDAYIKEKMKWVK